MYLKELGLHGFKSFPEKAILEFNKGVTAVVGPNGSGKSNISDAVRWVLGEQRVKNLRGDKMEDVIFAGTDNRKPIGFAEVSLTLDNEDGKIPVDYSEITVKRTVFRSGESKYTINGTPCRLKDINELFMDTGVGREGYSIIGQGRIDEILSTKNEDRRKLFEEAAGIAKYRSRRLEAMGKLAKEQENLVRIEDIIAEIETKIEPLREQSEGAKKFLILREELKKCEISIFIAKTEAIDKKIADYDKNTDIINADIEENEKKYNEAISKEERYKTEEKELLQTAESLNNKISELISDYQEKNGQIKLIEEQIRNFDEKIKRTESDFKTIGLKAEKIKNEIGIYESKKLSFDIQLNQLYNELEKKETEFENFNNELTEGEEKLNRFKSDIFEKMRTSAEIKTETENKKIRLKQLTDKDKELKNSISVSAGKLRQAEVHVLSAEKRIEDNNNQTESYKNILKSLEKEYTDVAEKLASAENSYRESSNMFSSSVSRYKVLMDMKNDFDGYYRSVKSVLKEGKNGNLKGIHGAVGELIKTDERYETAVETAVGAAMQNIVTDDEYTAKTAIEYLKRNNFGRATFMPVNVISGREIENKANIINYKGVCGIASDLVDYDEKYKGIIISLLGRVIIAENMDYAIKISQYTNRKYKIVTLDGDLINPGGAMTGGSRNQKSSNIFGRNREISELEEKCRKLKHSMEKFSSEVTDLTQSRKETEEGIANSRLVIHKFELEKQSLEDELKKAKTDFEEINQAAKNSQGEKVYISKNIEKIEEEIKALEESLSENEKEIELTDKKLEEYRNFVDVGRNEKDKYVSDITVLKISVSAAEQERSSAENNIDRLNDELKEIENQNNDFSELKAEYALALEEKRAELEETKKQAQICIEEKNKSEEKLKLTSEIRKELSAKSERISHITKEIYETISNLKNGLFRYETTKETLKNDKEKLCSSMWEEYEITYRQANELCGSVYNLADSERRARELKNIIKDLGSVNVNSIEEYTKTKERYDFLTSQRDDIKKAEDNLMKIIDDLEKLMKKQFSEQFGKISENFNEVFKEMFGGGKAYLKLSDSEDILESGIEIIAQPPGKTMQNMMLLSGGERSLTAIAILFAILKMKPSPFCILDEIEAALDDANVKRFADYLRKFSQTTQFIVISHRKGTMEAADVLYGVTMQEKGISKVISVRFEDIKDKEV